LKPKGVARTHNLHFISLQCDDSRGLCADGYEDGSVGWRKRCVSLSRLLIKNTRSQFALVFAFVGSRLAAAVAMLCWRPTGSIRFWERAPDACECGGGTDRPRAQCTVRAVSQFKANSASSHSQCQCLDSGSSF
jgi:hypothetical protein